MFKESKKLYLIIILIFSTLISCDYLYLFDIENKSNEEIIIKFTYDKNNIIENWNGSIESGLKFGLSGIEIISYDTIECNIYFKLKRNQSVTVDGGTNRKPDFKQFNKVEIFRKDSLIFLANKRILKSLYHYSETKKIIIN